MANIGKTAGVKLYEPGSGTSKWQVRFQEGKSWRRKYFSEKRAAEKYAREVARHIKIGGTGGFYFGADERAEYAACRRLFYGREYYAGLPRFRKAVAAYGKVIELENRW